MIADESGFAWSALEARVESTHSAVYQPKARQMTAVSPKAPIRDRCPADQASSVGNSSQAKPGNSIERALLVSPGCVESTHFMVKAAELTADRVTSRSDDGNWRGVSSEQALLMS